MAYSWHAASQLRRPLATEPRSNHLNACLHYCSSSRPQTLYSCLCDVESALTEQRVSIKVEIDNRTAGVPRLAMRHILSQLSSAKRVAPILQPSQNAGTGGHRPTLSKTPFATLHTHPQISRHERTACATQITPKVQDRLQKLQGTAGQGKYGPQSGLVADLVVRRSSTRLSTLPRSL